MKKLLRLKRGLIMSLAMALCALLFVTYPMPRRNTAMS
jgi:hypothetical protein